MRKAVGNMSKDIKLRWNRKVTLVYKTSKQKREEEKAKKSGQEEEQPHKDLLFDFDMTKVQASKKRKGKVKKIISTQ